jgi:hypothetical protein
MEMQVKVSRHSTDSPPGSPKHARRSEIEHDHSTLLSNMALPANPWSPSTLPIPLASKNYGTELFPAECHVNSPSTFNEIRSSPNKKKKKKNKNSNNNITQDNTLLPPLTSASVLTSDPGNHTTNESSHALPSTPFIISATFPLGASPYPAPEAPSTTTEIVFQEAMRSPHFHPHYLSQLPPPLAGQFPWFAQEDPIAHVVPLAVEPPLLDSVDLSQVQSPNSLLAETTVSIGSPSVDTSGRTHVPASSPTLDHACLGLARLDSVSLDPTMPHAVDEGVGKSTARYFPEEGKRKKNLSLGTPPGEPPSEFSDDEPASKEPRANALVLDKLAAQRFHFGHHPAAAPLTPMSAMGDNRSVHSDTQSRGSLDVPLVHAFPFLREREDQLGWLSWLAEVQVEKVRCFFLHARNLKQQENALHRKIRSIASERKEESEGETPVKLRHSRSPFYFGFDI